MKKYNFGKYLKILPVIISAFLLTCGIEDYPYIYPIPTGNITQLMNSRVRIVIPNSNLGNMYFTNFAIFYRIYISDIYEPSPSESNMNTINGTLHSDHSRVSPYIGNDNMASSSIASLFNGMRYYALELQEDSIDNVLSTSSFSKELVIDFTQTPGSIPTLAIGTSQYYLYRSDGGGTFELLPENRYFVNSTELRRQSNIDDPHINADVTDKANITERQYSYISMYIVAIGFDPQTYVQLYSSPAFAGVLCLPNTN